jgi:hypothetical protein
MKCNHLFLTVFAAALVLFSQISCYRQVCAAEESKATPSASQPAEEQAPEPAADKSPKIRFEKLIHDFGKISPGKTKLCEFKFTNAGDGLLKIGKIQSTCGCTVPQLKKKQYYRGESGTIKVEYRPGNYAGIAKKRLFVNSNDKTSSRVTLTIKATIVKKVDYEPKRLNLLLKKENAGCGEITLFSLDKQPFAIKQFQSTNNAITADINPSVKKTTFVLQPRVDIEKLRNDLNGRININLTHPECKTVTITFSTLPEFKVNPAAIIVFNVKPQKPVERELWILNNYNEDFEIESVSSDKGAVKVLSQEKVGKRYKFQLQITPPTAENKQRIFADMFRVNIKGGGKLEILCRGFYLRDKDQRPKTENRKQKIEG